MRLCLPYETGFAKTALGQALRDVGIAYRHMRALGCPKPIRDRYRAEGDWSAYTVAFLEHLAAQEAALADLADEARSRRTALLCFEADFLRCHRTFVARAVATRLGASIRHITPDGEVPEGGLVQTR